MRVVSSALAAVFLLSCAVGPVAAQTDSPPVLKDRNHDTAEWASIAAHLPDTATSSAGTLEVAADTLRARRYPEEAVLYYRASMARGGDPHSLLKKMGIACLEMQQITLARSYFQQAVRLNKRDASAWNNLAAAEFIQRDNSGAIHDYKKAVKLDRNSAVFHANLSLAYFENRNVSAARRELARGLALDPELLHRTGQNGYVAQVLASERYSEICFEMARIYASQGNLEAMLEWLTKASDRGFDVRSAMNHDPALRPMLANPQVQVLLKNSQQLQARGKAPANIPALGREE